MNSHKVVVLCRSLVKHSPLWCLLFGLGLPAASPGQEDTTGLDAEPSMDEVARSLLQTSQQLNRELKKNTLELEKQMHQATVAIEDMEGILYPPLVPPDISIVNITSKRALIKIKSQGRSVPRRKRVVVGSVIEDWTVVAIDISQSTVTLQSKEGELFVAR